MFQSNSHGNMVSEGYIKQWYCQEKGQWREVDGDGEEPVAGHSEVGVVRVMEPFQQVVHARIPSFNSSVVKESIAMVTISMVTLLTTHLPKRTTCCLSFLPFPDVRTLIASMLYLQTGEGEETGLATPPNTHTNFKSPNK